MTEPGRLVEWVTGLSGSFATPPAPPPITAMTGQPPPTGGEQYTRPE